MSIEIVFSFLDILIYFPKFRIIFPCVALPILFFIIILPCSGIQKSIKMFKVYSGIKRQRSPQSRVSLNYHASKLWLYLHFRSYCLKCNEMKSESLSLTIKALIIAAFFRFHFTYCFLFTYSERILGVPRAFGG